MSDENEQLSEAIRRGISASPDGAISLLRKAVRTGWMQDESSELQDFVLSLTVPQPGGYMVDALDAPGVTAIGLSAAYVLGVDNVGLARPGRISPRESASSRSWCPAATWLSCPDPSASPMLLSSSVETTR